MIAGKAHPRDEDGKRLVHALFAAKTRPGFGAGVVFLEDYDLRSARSWSPAATSGSTCRARRSRRAARAA